MPKMLKMHTNLMRPATVQPAFEQARGASTAHDFEIRSRFSPTFARDRHFLAMNSMPRDCGHNRSGTATHLPADAVKIFAMRQQGINQCAASPSSARMNRNSRRFVYNNQVVVFEQNGERDLFWDQVNRLNRWFHHGNAVTRLSDVACARRTAIYRHETLPDKGLNSRARKLGSGVCEKPIQAGARIRCFNDKLAAVFLCH